MGQEYYEDECGCGHGHGHGHGHGSDRGHGHHHGHGDGRCCGHDHHSHGYGHRHGGPYGGYGRRHDSPFSPTRAGKIVGTTTVGERGQVVIPREAREILNLRGGDRFVVFASELGDAVTLVKADKFEEFAGFIMARSRNLEDLANSILGNNVDEYDDYYDDYEDVDDFDDEEEFETEASAEVESVEDIESDGDKA